jgi:hypothetical protein
VFYSPCFHRSFCACFHPFSIHFHAYLREEKEQWAVYGAAANDSQTAATKLIEVKAELRRRMHHRIPEVGQGLLSVVAGHSRYCGVPWHRALLRRSQTSHIPWDRMHRLIVRWLPPVRIYHPYPLRRMSAVTQVKSQMRERRSPQPFGWL